MLARLGYETVALTRQLDADVYLRSIGAASVEQVPRYGSGGSPNITTC